MLADDGGVGRGSLAAAQLAHHLGALRGCQAAAEFFLRRVLSYQGAVRAMISATITRPELAASHRPGIRFGLIDQAPDRSPASSGCPRSDWRSSRTISPR